MTNSVWRFFFSPEGGNRLKATDPKGNNYDVPLEQLIADPKVSRLLNAMVADLSAEQPRSIEAIARGKEPPGQVYGIICPDYGRIFTIARAMAWQDGYACCMQGSFTRDLDLLLVPWAEPARADSEILIKRIAEAAGLKINGKPGSKPHGRKAYTLMLPGFGDPRFVDISVTPFPEECLYDVMLNGIGIPPGTPKERLGLLRSGMADAVASDPSFLMTDSEKAGFAELLHRALRTWEDAPAKWVALHDRLTGVPAPAVRAEGGA